MTKALRWRSQRCPHCGERIEWRYDLDIRFRSKSRGRARESGGGRASDAGQALPRRPAEVVASQTAAAKALPRYISPQEREAMAEEQEWLADNESSRRKKGGRGEGKEGAHAGETETL